MDAEGTCKVLIVGAGPTGLLAAIELRRNGVSAEQIRIIDAKSRVLNQNHARAIAVHVRTMEVLRDAGVIDRFKERGRAAAGAVFFNNKGDRLFRLTAEVLDSVYTMAVVLGQYDTEDILRVALEKTWGVQVEYRTKLAEIQGNENFSSFLCNIQHLDEQEESVVVGEEQISCEYLLGCDGAHSPIRHELGFPQEGEDIRVIWTLADLNLKCRNFEIRPELGGHAFLGHHGLVGIAPLSGDGQWRLLVDWKEEDEYQVPKTLSVEWFQKIVDEKIPQYGFELGEPLWLTKFTVRQRMASTFRRGNCFLLGDAAHNHSPSGGQGMNFGLQDAYNLCWKLALVLEHGVDPGLLDTYSEERVPVARGVLQLTGRSTQMMAMQNGILIWIRNFILWLVFLLPLMHRATVMRLSQVGLTYHGSSSLNWDNVGRTSRWKGRVQKWLGCRHAPRPGDRAPCADTVLHCGVSRPLLDILGNGMITVLLVEGDVEFSAAVNDGVKRVALAARIQYLRLCARTDCGDAKSRTIVLDTTGSVTANYTCGENTLFIIRPDGYVCYREQPGTVERMTEYLEGIHSPR